MLEGELFAEGEVNEDSDDVLVENGLKVVGLVTESGEAEFFSDFGDIACIDFFFEEALD